MHDVVHDFAQFLTKNECLIVEKTIGEAKREMISPKNASHLYLLANEAINSKDLFSICQTEKIWSFLCRRKEIPKDFLSHLKRVRWLKLEDCKLLDIPREIGDLVRIRYLDLSRNPMKELPETICHLQTLKIRSCSGLSELPLGISKLKNLRHILIYGTAKMFFSRGLEKLAINLREFDYFCLGHLKDLNKIRGSLRIHIYDLDDAYDQLAEAKVADLKNKKFIHFLSLYFGDDVELEIIDALQPSPNLSCIDFRAHQLPNWIATLTNLRKLHVSNVCNGIHLLHSLRNFSSLEELTLFNLKLERLSLDFFGIHTASATSAFPRLKKLSIYSCEGLKEWEDIGEEDGDMINISVLLCLEVFILDLCGELPHRLLRMA